MNRLRIILWTVIGVLVTSAIVLVFVQYLPRGVSARPLPVPEGDQEIAWFQPATSGATWERFVTGAHRAARLNPQLVIDDSRAFLDETTAAPELVIGRRDTPHRLRIRWYKQSSRMKVDDWIKALAQRTPPPLAILGGGSSDRALELARILAANTQWRGEPPLLLITTATANTVYVESGGLDARRDLMKVYPNRTFRFCFTNRQMANAVLDFVWKMPELQPHGHPAPLLGAVGLAASGDVIGCAALAAQAEYAPEVFALEWQDDPYSVDLSEQFREVFFTAEGNAPWKSHGRSPPQLLTVSSSVGGFLRPNDTEAEALENLLNPPFMLRALPRNGLQRSLLILPAAVAPARRVLAGLAGADPAICQSLVAVSGDSISFANVYRDAELLWNIRLVPMPLVLFTHQSPVAWDADEAPQRGEHDPFALYPPNGTDDVLHFAQIARLLGESAWQSTAGQSRLVANANELAARLRQLDPPFFDADGNRLGGSGESIIYLRPEYNESGLRGAILEVWSHRDAAGWQFVKRLPVRYR